MLNGNFVSKFPALLGKLTLIFSASIIAIVVSQLALSVIGLLFIMYLAKLSWQYVYKILRSRNLNLLIRK